MAKMHAVKGGSRRKFSGADVSLGRSQVVKKHTEGKAISARSRMGPGILSLGLQLTNFRKQLRLFLFTLIIRFSLSKIQSVPNFCQLLEESNVSYELLQNDLPHNSKESVLSPANIPNTTGLFNATRFLGKHDCS